MHICICIATSHCTYMYFSSWHYNDVIMGPMASRIPSLTIVYSIVYSGADQRKHQSSASLAFEWGIHRSPVNSPHKWPVTRKIFPFDNIIKEYHILYVLDWFNWNRIAHILGKLSNWRFLQISNNFSWNSIEVFFIKVQLLSSLEWFGYYLGVQ